MTARAPKPKKSPAPLRGVAAAPVEPEFKLTPAEMRLVQAYRALKDDTQDYLDEVMQNLAAHKDLQRHKQPALRLVSGVKS